MSVNLYQPNLLILCEDQAYLDFFHGFRLHHAINSNITKELAVAGGWETAVASLKNPKSIARMTLHKFPKSHLLLLIDSDQNSQRIDDIINDPDLALIQNRLFILSAYDEAEPLHSSLGGGLQEATGAKLAESCHSQNCDLWKNAPDLKHNLAQIQRLKDALPELFL